MVALAPNTSETSSWDILDGFPKLHSRAREVKTRICTEAPHSKSLVRVEIWLVISESCVGLESFTRDPIGYHDGVSLYRNYLEMRHLDPGGELLWLAPTAVSIIKTVVVVGGIVVAAVTIEVLVIDTLAEACKKDPTSPQCKQCPPKPICPCDRNASTTKSTAHSVLNLAESGWTDRDGNPILRPFSNHWQAAMFEKEHGKAAHDALIRLYNPGFQGESHLGEFEGPCDSLKDKVMTLQRQLADCGRNGFSIPPNCGDALGFGSRMLDNRCKPLGFGGGVLGVYGVNVN